MTNPYAPPGVAVRDVLDPHAATAQADLGGRLGASILDTVIFSAMVYGPFFAVASVGTIASGVSGPPPDDPAALFALFIPGIVAGCIGLIAWLWPTFVFLRRNSQSIGKKLVGIKVVRSDGSPVSLSRLIWLRNVVLWVLSIIPLFGLIDVLFIFGESRQCLHDKIADTIVIKA